MKKKYKNALKIGVGAAALGASNYLGKRAGEQDIAKKILASYTGDTDTVLKKTSAFGIAKPTARNKGGGMDMGHKPRPRGNPGIVENVVGKGGDYIKDLID